jgi:hypothetical protein
MILIYITIAVTSLGFFAFWWFKKRKEKPTDEKHSIPKAGLAETKDLKSTTLSVRARIYDNISGTKYNCNVSGEIVDKIINDHETLGREWNFYGEKVYALNRRMDGTFFPVFITPTLSNPPSQLRRMLTHPYTAFTWNMKKPKGIFAKYGPIIWLSVLAIIVVFLLVAK